jgi:predicted permease
MNEIFIQAFGGMFSAIAKIFLIALFAGILVKKDIIKQEYIKGMSELTVKILLPSLIFSKTILTFAPDSTPGWWVLPVVGFFSPIFFLGVASLFFIRDYKNQLSKLPVAAFQNAGYLVLPVGQILYPNNFDEFALYSFLFILGFNPALWSVGKFLITKTHESLKFDIKDIITPPLIANILALTFVFLNINKKIPDIIFEPIDLMGSATVPMAMFILGATVGTISLKQLPPFWDIFKVIFVKFGITPAVAFFILYYFNIAEKSPILADFIIIEASAAPAANLILMVKKYGGDAQKTGSLMFISYIAAIPLMPLWIALWKMFQ